MALPEQPHRAEPADGPSCEDRIARGHPVSGPTPLLRPAEHITRGGGNVNAADSRTPHACGDSTRAAVGPGFLAEAWHAMSIEGGIAPKGFAPNWRDQLAACFAAGIRDGTHGWFVASAGGDLVASAAALMRMSAFGEAVHRRPAVLAGVFVAPAWRRQGIARALTTRAIAWAHERGCTHLSLHATAAAEPLYRALGFEDEREMVLKLT